MDIVDAATRSRMMSRIRGRNTLPERIVRRGLHAAGFRFRLHPHGVPGTPDLVLPKYRAAILVHGCFWHRHANCRFATSPSTNSEKWEAKFRANVKRDHEVQSALAAAGWRVAMVWECSLSRERVGSTLSRLERWLTSSRPHFETRPNARKANASRAIRSSRQQTSLHGVAVEEHNLLDVGRAGVGVVVEAEALQHVTEERAPDQRPRALLRDAAVERDSRSLRLGHPG